MARQKTHRGRPPPYTMPERIDASPAELADVVLRAEPPKVWRYMVDAEREKLEREAAND